MPETHTTEEITDMILQTLKAERLSLEKALAFISRCEEKAKALGIPMVITVVDDGGNQVAMHRMDDSLLASITISYAKAYTAAALRKATDAIAADILPGQPLYGIQNTHPGQFCLFGGGIPILENNRCLGGLGVSGGTVEQDIMVAQYAFTNK